MQSHIPVTSCTASHDTLLHPGDYDGDQFFVCWDERLIPPEHKLHKPLDYSAAPETVTARVDHGTFVKYFADYDPSILGRLDA